ncbi:MAG: alpha/beta hydrolase [Myxococcota bacterium]
MMRKCARQIAFPSWAIVGLVLVASSVSSAVRAAPEPSHAVVQAPKVAAGRLVQHSVGDSVFRSRFKYMVYVPPGPQVAGERLPTLVALHGLGGDHTSWKTAGLPAELDRAIAGGTLPRCLVFFPSGKNGFWTDWSDGRHPYRAALGRQLDDFLMRYPADTRPGRMALVGFSMGGFGTLSMGLLQPERYGLLVALSPTDLELGLDDPTGPAVYRQLVGKGPRAEALLRLNPRHLVKSGRARAGQVVLLAYGESEPPRFSTGTALLYQALKEKGVDSELMAVKQGQHGWQTTWLPVQKWWIERLGRWWRDPT